MWKAKKSCSEVCSEGSQNVMGYIAPAKGLISVKVKVVERERQSCQLRSFLITWINFVFDFDYILEKVWEYKKSELFLYKRKLQKTSDWKNIW